MGRRQAIHNNSYHVTRVYRAMTHSHTQLRQIVQPATLRIR